MTESELIEMARQLSKPDGEAGIQIAMMMNQGNWEMIRCGINALEIQSGERILELGHASGGHLKAILDSSERLHYTGLEISKDMKEMAEVEFRSLNHVNTAEFLLFDGVNLPVPEKHHDKVLTVNTVYFWEDPMKYMAEISRVLKPGGMLVLVFSPRHFMENLPFTAHIFKLYEPDEVAEILNVTGFENLEISAQKDSLTTNSGEQVERIFYVVKAFKPC